MHKKMSKIFTLLVLFLGVTLNSFAIKVEREIFPKEMKPGQSVIVSITINKQGEEGFAKLMENLPEDFVAEELNSATGNFIYEDGKVRIIWLTMPEGNSFRAEYKLIYQGTGHGYFKIDGKFYFVKDGKRSEFKLSNSSVKVLEPVKSKGPTVVPKITTKAIVRDTTEEVPVVAIAEPKEVNEEKKSEIVVSMAVSSVTEKPDSVTEPEKDKESPEVVELKIVKPIEPVETTTSEVVFKVQLGVFSSEKDLKVFGDLPEVHFITVGKFYKYYSGKFSSEFEARSVIDKAKANGFQGAFLVRFKDGKRI